MHRSRRHASTRGGFVNGCLVVIGIVVVLLVVAGIVVAVKWKSWAVTLTTKVVERVVAEAGLPPEQGREILVEVKKLGDDFKEGRISSEDLQRVMKEISESPLIPLAGVQGARRVYIEPSSMTAAEKAAANRSVERFARGAFEKTIPRTAIDEVLAPLMTEKDGRKTLKENPTREDVDRFVALAKQNADAARVPDVPFEMNAAEELRKAINTALKRP